LADGEPQEDLTEYERLERELRASPGLVDTLVEPITAGIEMTSFAATRPGKILIGEALEAARECLLVILDTNSTPQQMETAIAEIRIRHRMLNSIKNTMVNGRNAERKLRLLESPEPQGNDESQPETDL